MRRAQFLMAWLVAVASAALPAAPLAAEVIVYDNSDGAFVWVDYVSISEPGNYLDITQPPLQSGTLTSHGIRKRQGRFEGEPDARIARDHFGVSFGSTPFFVALQYGPTAVVNPPSVFWEATASFRLGQILLGESATIAVQLTMPTGIHYGWIQLEVSGNSYKPIAWSYETEPFITIVGPGTPDADHLLHVPQEYPSIRAAMNRAVDGDAIIVADGTYGSYSNVGIDFQGKAVTLRSANGPANCILDGNDLTRGIYFHAGEGPDSILDGFTITNCRAWGDRGVGGGGGIKCHFSNPTIRNCIVRENGSFISWDDSFLSRAGGFYAEQSSPFVANCAFVGNKSWYSAGTESHGAITNFVLCTFTGNDSVTGLTVTGQATLTNCIIFGEKGGSPEGGPAALLTVTYSCVEGGAAGEGNIDADPDFVDADGPDNNPATFADNDYHLAAGSPCIDAASNPAVPRDLTEDLDGNPRFVDDPATTDTGLGRAPIVDMGAFEFQPPFDPADLDQDGDVDGFDLALLLGQWTGAASYAPCPPHAPADLNSDCQINGFDLALLLGAWGGGQR